MKLKNFLHCFYKFMSMLKFYIVLCHDQLFHSMCTHVLTTFFLKLLVPQRYPTSNENTIGPPTRGEIHIQNPDFLCSRMCYASVYLMLFPYSPTLLSPFLLKVLRVIVNPSSYLMLPSLFLNSPHP